MIVYCDHINNTTIHIHKYDGPFVNYSTSWISTMRKSRRIEKIKNLFNIKN
jgi:hypothetical protein